MNRLKLYGASLILGILVLCGCGVGQFRPIITDPATGFFCTSVKACEKDILSYKLLPGVLDTRFVLFQTSTSMNEEAFEAFLQESLKRIGFKRFLNKSDLAQFVIQNELSDQIATVTDLVSLHKLNEVIGPFLQVYSSLYTFGDARYEFEFILVDPGSGQKVLEISRADTCMWDFNKEICYPVLNVIKTWHDQSSQLIKSEPVKADKKEI